MFNQPAFDLPNLSGQTGILFDERWQTRYLRADGPSELNAPWPSHHPALPQPKSRHKMLFRGPTPWVPVRNRTANASAPLGTLPIEDLNRSKQRERRRVPFASFVAFCGVSPLAPGSGLVGARQDHAVDAIHELHFVNVDEQTQWNIEQLHAIIEQITPKTLTDDRVRLLELLSTI